MLGRRSFLRGAAAAPFAAKPIAEQAVKQLSGISMGTQLGGFSVPNSFNLEVPPMAPSEGQWLRVLGDRVLRKELESIYYERERDIGRIDHDIACLRSFSVSAKIAYQRERNVKRTVEGLGDRDGWWGRFNKFSNRIMGI